MSYQLMAWATEQRTGSPTRKAVLIALANRANHDTLACWPSIEKLSEETEFGTTAIKTALKDLCDMGLLQRERRRRNDGSLGTYSYTFPFRSRGDQPGTAGVSSPGTGGVSRNQEEPNQDPPNPPVGGNDDQIRQVYDHWREARGRHRANYEQMSPARMRKIRQRLREGYTVEDLCAAIDAVAIDPWPDRPKHDDLTVIFRSREQTDRFLEMAEKLPDGRRRLSPLERATLWITEVGWQYDPDTRRDELRSLFPAIADAELERLMLMQIKRGD